MCFDQPLILLAERGFCLSFPFSSSCWCKKRTSFHLSEVFHPCMLLMHTSHCWHWYIILYSLVWTYNWTESAFLKNPRRWWGVGGMLLGGFSRVALSCLCLECRARLLKGPSAWLIQDYTGRQLVSFQWVSALLSVILEERLPWNQLSSLCCITLPTWWCTVLVTSPIRDLTRHVVQLLFGCDFIASVKSVWRWILVVAACGRTKANFWTSLKWTLSWEPCFFFFLVIPL